MALPFQEFPVNALLNYRSRWSANLTLAWIAQKGSGTAGKYSSLEVANKCSPSPAGGTQYCVYKEGYNKFPGAANVTANQGDPVHGSHWSSRGNIRESSAAALQNFTFALICTFLGTPTAETVICSNGRHDLPGFYVAYTAGAPNGLRFLTATAATYTYSQASSLWTANELCVFVARGTAGGYVDLFGNGEEAASYSVRQAQVGIGMPSSAVNFYVGGCPGYYNEASGNVVQHAALLWNRAMNNSEIRSFSLDPFEVFRGARRTTLAVKAVGGFSLQLPYGRIDKLNELIV